ncbi:hypothetical protein G3M48_007831 [Beauveria asiatica]|uniref:Uncharacterized protein n=1 Tax=Beauveria asiatica TaxID=1069075 RepID=A0AAW0RM92_9HYPO
MAIIDGELSARVAQILERFKIVIKTKKCRSAHQKRLTVKNLLQKNFEDSLVDDLFENYKMSLILDEAVRQLQHGITTTTKSRRSPRIKFKHSRDVQEESIKNSDVQDIKAIPTKASPTAGLSFTTTTKSRQSLSIKLEDSVKLEDSMDVKEESIKNSDVQDIKAIPTKASPTAGASSTAAAFVFSPEPNAVADSETQAQSDPEPTNGTLRDYLGELQKNLATQNRLLAALLRAQSTRQIS